MDTRALRVFAAAACALAPLVAPSPVAAEVSFSAAMTPGTIHYPRTRLVEYRLTIRTGTEDERLTVRLFPPLWGGGQDGSPVRLASAPRLVGAGQIVDFRETAVSSSADICRRGYAPTWPVVDVAVPAGSVSTLVATYRTGRAAPWPRTDYRVRFQVRRAGVRGATWVAPSRPDVVGLSGVRITLAPRPVEPRPGQSVRILGRTSPAVAGDVVRLGIARTERLAPGEAYFEGPAFPENFSRPGLLAEVPVDERGRFALTWRGGEARRFYAIWATYRPQRRGIVGDRGCEVVLWVE